MKHIFCSLLLISSAIHGCASTDVFKKKVVSLNTRAVPQQLLNQLLLHHSNQTDKDGLDFVVSLLQANADVNTKDQSGFTPLRYAAKNFARADNFFTRMWTSQIMQFLVRANADVTGVDKAVLAKMSTAIQEQKKNNFFCGIPAQYALIQFPIVADHKCTDWLPIALSLDCCSKKKSIGQKKVKDKKPEGEDEFTV